MSLFDLSSVVESLATQTVVVSRRPASVYNVDGILQSTAYVAVATLKASVQPSTDSLNRKAEGLQETNTHDMWVVFDVRDKDRVSFAGETYEVESVDKWFAGGNYHKARLRRLAPTEV